MTDNNMQNNLNLKQTVRFFETLLRASADGIVITDTANSIVFVNDTFCKYFSTKRHDMIETNLFIWLAKLGNNAKDIWKGLETHINEHGIAKDVEFEMKTADVMRYFSVNSSLLEKIDIEEAGLIISIWRDDTERKKSEKALKQAHDELEMRVKERTAQLANTNIELKREIIERKYVEEALHVEKDNLVRIFEAMIDGVYIVDKKYDIQYANPVLKKDFGPNIGRKCYEYFHDRTEICPWCKNEDVFAGKTIRWEWYSSKTDRTYDLIDTPLINPDGTIYKLEMFRDVTERKQTEKDLEEAIIKAQNEKNKSESIIAALGDAISIQDTDFKVLYQNKIHQEIVGDQKGRYCYREYEHRDNICDGCPVNRSFKDGEIHNEERIIIKNGKRLCFDIKSSPLRDSTGKIIAGIEIGRDITERKLAEEQNQMMKHSIDVFYDGIYWMDTDDKFIYVNEAGCKAFGYSYEELMNMTVYDVNPKASKHGMKLVWDMLRTKGFFSVESVHRRKDGTEFPVEIRSTYVQFAGREYIGGYARDLSEQKRAEKERMELLALEHEARIEVEAARKLDSMKSMFLASTSHELRTPLNSIIGFSSLILDGVSGKLNPEQKEQLEIVHSSGKHLLALINDIIDVSQMEAGTKNVEVSKFKLGDVVVEAISILNIILKEKKLELKVDVGDILMKSDRRRLLQCIMNLLGNAIKYTEKGSVAITAKVIHNNVEISVIDTGIGIKAEEIPTLFGPFVRLQSPLTLKTSGTGLGLYLVKKLTADYLGGDVYVKSEYGKGSTFTLHVPVELEGVGRQ